jgi:hypothetical protein
VTVLESRTAPAVSRAEEPPSPDGGREAGRRRDGWWGRLWPALVPLVVLSVVYDRTLQRSTGNYFSVDTTKFDYLGLVLGTAHPPGYPLYTMLNAAVVRLVPEGSVALRANLLSAALAVLTCVLAVAVLRHLGVGRALAAGGATALGLLLPFWRYAVVAEVYTLTTTFLFAVLACVLRYEATGRRGWLRAGVLVFALSFAHATSNVLLVPGLVAYLALRGPTWLLRPRELVRLLPAGALLALAPYAYLPWRTAAGGSTYLDSEVTDLASFWDVITAERFAGQMFGVPTSVVWQERLPQLGEAALAAFGPLLVAAAVGLVVLLWTRPRVGVLLLAWVLVTATFVVWYRVSDWFTLLLPVWVLVALWVVVGLDRAVRVLGRRPGAVLAVLVAVALPVAGLVTGYTQADRRGLDPQVEVDAALAAVEDGSLIFTADNGTRHLFTYRLLPGGLGERRNVWASRGRGSELRSNPDSYRIRTYCAPDAEPWVWSRQERAIAPTVARGLKTYVFGTRYARAVRADGFRLTHVSGKLYRFDCASAPSSTPTPPGR